MHTPNYQSKHVDLKGGKGGVSIHLLMTNHAKNYAYIAHQITKCRHKRRMLDYTCRQILKLLLEHGMLGTSSVKLLNSFKYIFVS